MSEQVVLSFELQYNLDCFGFQILEFAHITQIFQWRFPAVVKILTHKTRKFFKCHDNLCSRCGWRGWRKGWKQESSLLLKFTGRILSSLLFIQHQMGLHKWEAEWINSTFVWGRDQRGKRRWEGLCGVSVARLPWRQGNSPHSSQSLCPQHKGQQHWRGESLQRTGP